MKRNTLLELLALSAVILAAGCGTGGPREHHVSGQVTFRDNPVPAGVIRFLPDTAQGNQGPAGYAPIENGRYDTARSGRGTVGGPHTVVISGYDGQADPSQERPHGAPLFREYQITANVGENRTTLDFAVPVTAP